MRLLAIPLMIGLLLLAACAEPEPEPSPSSPPTQAGSPTEQPPGPPGTPVLYDALFAERVDPLHDHWDKPILFYTIHLPAHPDNPDPIGEEFQAKRLEAIFQALLERPWVAGSFSWAYTMIDAPLSGDDGVRDRLAEAVLAKYYGAFAGR